MTGEGEIPDTISKVIMMGVDSENNPKPVLVDGLGGLSMPWSRMYPVVVAPFDAPDNLKANADFVCEGMHDQEVINEAIEYVNTTYGDVLEYSRCGILLLEGNFLVDGPILWRNNIYIMGLPDSWTNIYLDDREEAEYPENDWYLFESKDTDLTTPFNLFLTNLFVYNYGWTSWGEAGGCKGVINIDGKKYFTAKNCDFGSIIAGMFTVSATATLCRLAFHNSSIWSDSASIDNLIDLSSATIRSTLQFLNCYLGYATNGIKLGNQNPNVAFQGYLQYSNLTNIFNGTSSNITTYGSNALKRSGTAVVPNGATYVDVTHGRAKTPTAKEIHITPTNDKASVWWISNIGATTFRINIPTEPGATTATYEWSIE